MPGKLRFTRRMVYDVLHVVVLLLSILLVVGISVDTFKDIAFYNQPRFLKLQLMVCLFFLIDFFVEFFMSDRKRHYLWTHAVFFFVSIPYQFIISYFNIELPPELNYILRFAPLTRGGYALAIVIGWFTSNRVTGMFITYLLILVSTLYFVSMSFYVVEHNINPGVENYLDALWWACMEMTTAGSSINAITPAGRFLGFFMACFGLMIMPMMTVYISSLIKRHGSILDNDNQKPSVSPEATADSSETDNSGRTNGTKP